jgi:hypothetical protein
MAKAKNKTPKQRNYVALSMITRGWGAGNHGDKRKEQSRNACRGKYK